MFGQRLARRLAEAVHHVEDAGGQARLVRDLDEQRARSRAPLGRLVDDGASGGERRRDLPRRQHERRVPRRDHADRADRLAHRVVDVRRRSAARDRRAASGARSAKKRKFSAPRNAALLMKRIGCPVSTHSTSAISSARATIASAMSCKQPAALLAATSATRPGTHASPRPPPNRCRPRYLRAPGRALRPLTERARRMACRPRHRLACRR